jgi:Peptidoglycan-synthase activator LpoB/Putative peptidoglycan binding domain
MGKLVSPDFRMPPSSRPILIAILLTACESGSMPSLDSLHASLMPGAGPEVAGGYYAEAYACRRIAVASFDGEGGDWVAGQVEAGLARVGTYQLVDRRQIAEALDELGFQSTALVDRSTAVRVGKIVGADCILSGDVNLARVERESYQERVCDVMGAQFPVPSDNLCPGKMSYASCEGLKADAVIVPRLVDVESGTVVFAQTASGDASDRSCRGDRLDSPSSQAELQQTAISNAVDVVVADLTPKTSSGATQVAAESAACPRVRNGADVRRAQEMLADLGYRPGTPDGQLGGKTAVAAQEFAVDHDYQPADGQLTSCLMTEIAQRHQQALESGTLKAPSAVATTQEPGEPPAGSSGPFEDLGLE